MSKYVLDASALLALLNQEKGKERVEALLPDSIISAANFCEALGKLIDAGMNETDARESYVVGKLRLPGTLRARIDFAKWFADNTKWLSVIH